MGLVGICVCLCVSWLLIKSFENAPSGYYLNEIYLMLEKPFSIELLGELNDF